MPISVTYQKRKNAALFHKLQTNSKTNLANIQNYIPIYERFFSLNATNWNAVNLNHVWNIADIADIANTSSRAATNHPIFTCNLKHIEDDSIECTQQVFIKMAPLLDPLKYILGKYNYKDPNLFVLPSFSNKEVVHSKMANPNNSSFIDGFFSFLTSKVLHDHNFLHGIDYYGSFLAIKRDYKINIFDDLEYLVQSPFFNQQREQRTLYTVDDFSFSSPLHMQRPPLQIQGSLSATSLVFENLTTVDATEPIITLDEMKANGMELVDIYSSHSSKGRSTSTYSSRTSHTNNSADNDQDDHGSQYDDQKRKSVEEEEEEETNDFESENSSYVSSIEEDVVMLTFPEFPVQVICMECCENTLDELVVNDQLNDDEWFSALMQIIMMLITYQKLFSFTHNDLHTGNIMYVTTTKKFLYYIYNQKTYRVPTFGRLYKIIDFGRAIYQFGGKVFCSDSFQAGGDASGQYNTEPYLNDKKRRIEPNFSFDLCRLACPIFYFVVDDFDVNAEADTPIGKLIKEWCIDDNGINVLYKNNGVERYPDFKLYKMIARCVHHHTPQAQLKRKEFSKYLWTKKVNPMTEYLCNIDQLPTYT